MSGPIRMATRTHSNRHQVNSVEKALGVLKVFDPTRPRLTPSQVASLAEKDLSTAQRFVHTLTELGYLDKDPSRKTTRSRRRSSNCRTATRFRTNCCTV